MGLDGKGWWHEKIKDRESGKQNWGNVAGQFLLKGKQKHGAPNESDADFADRFIEDREAIKEFLASLFIHFADSPLDSEFSATSKLK